MSERFQTLHPFMESYRSGTLCKLRTCWLLTHLLSVVPGCLVQGTDGRQRAHSDSSGAAIRSV